MSLFFKLPYTWSFLAGPAYVISYYEQVNYMTILRVLFVNSVVVLFVCFFCNKPHLYSWIYFILFIYLIYVYFKQAWLLASVKCCGRVPNRGIESQSRARAFFIWLVLAYYCDVIFSAVERGLRRTLTASHSIYDRKHQVRRPGFIVFAVQPLRLSFSVFQG